VVGIWGGQVRQREAPTGELSHATPHIPTHREAHRHTERHIEGQRTEKSGPGGGHTRDTHT
jgi:hypothetical protein